MPELPHGSMPVPATPLSALKRWQLDIQCSRCKRHIQINVEDLAGRYPSNARIGEVLMRLRCSGLQGDERCNARPSKVKLAEVARYGKSMRKMREITVL